MGVRLAKELGVVLPVSFYEKEVNNLTIRSHASMRMEGFLGFIEKHISQMTTIIRKILFYAGRYRISHL